MWIAFLLALIIAFFSRRVQEFLRACLHEHPARIWLLPPLLTLIFFSAGASRGVVSAELTLEVLLYTAAPVLCAWVQKPAMVKRPGMLDFVTILLLWLPLEFPAGAARLVDRHAQGFLHTIAYGIAILLGLTLFIGFRSMTGMKFNLPERRRDLWLALAAYGATAPVLMAVGIWIGFIPPPHLPTVSVSRMAAAIGIIFAATGLPEEILFRSMIQNLMMQRFGATTRTLAAASIIFGAAHLDNGPQPLPNWRYMILATIAGFAYGKVFQKSSTVLSSTLLHAMVDWTKHFFF